jgi:tetratricopeptide (TPR) repeat protein
MAEAPPPPRRSANELKDKGNEAFRNKRFGEAISLYTRALSAGGERHVLLANRAAAWLASGDAPHALKDAQESVQANGGFPQGHARVGAALMALGRAPEAVKAFRKALELDPSSETIKTNLKVARAAAKAAAEPVKEEAPPLKDEPSETATDTEALKEMGNVAFKEGDAHRAVVLYSRALAAPGGGGNHLVLSNRAAAYTQIGTREALMAAIADATRCAALRPDFAKAHLRKARALLALGRAVDAQSAARAGLRLEPMNPQLREALTEADLGVGGSGVTVAESWRASKEAALLVAGEREASRQEAERGVSVSKEDEEALAELEALLSSRGKRGRDDDDDDDNSDDDDEKEEIGPDGEVIRRAVLALGWEDAEPTAEERAEAVAEAETWEGGEPSSQLDRLLGKHAKWRNLNPFWVLDIGENVDIATARGRFRKLSALVHPDKHPARLEDARTAFEFVKKAMESLEEPEGIVVARRLVREGRRAAEKHIRRLERQRVMAGEPSAKRAKTESAVGPDERRELLDREILKVFAAEAYRARMRQESQLREVAEDAREVDEERAAMSREASQDTQWGTEREKRIDSWRSFQSKGGNSGVKRNAAQAFGGKAVAAAAASASSSDAAQQFRNTWR